MKDFIGKEVNIGDRVAYIASEYRFLKIGEIAQIYPKTVRIISESEMYYNGEPKDFRKSPNEFIKI